MPPKKSAAPPPHSDESDIFEEDAAKKTKKKTTKSVKKQRGDSKDAEEALKKATDELFDGSDVEDDGRDLFEYVKSLPDRPEFLSRRDNAERLMILNVEVNNFKSYYGKASIGPFHRSFTSIIGPNGSGKSNLIDSLLFVFGFRASKIRSDKLANLIHKSAGRQPDSCTVTIYFQRIVDAIQPDQYRVVPNSLFTIARTAYKNGNTSYSIDGRAASKSEVEARLRLVDIDIEHNRFLILQGEVEQIAMMKPVRTNKNEIGMVEYLEDIVGSNRIAPFTRAFEIRVKGLNCEVSQQRIARDHARSSKIAMEGSVRTAIEFLSKENEAKIIQMKLDQRRRKQYLDKVAPQKAEIEAKEEEAKALSQQLDANNIEVKTLEEKEKELMKKRSRIDGEFDQLTKEVDDLLSEETRRKETIKRYETDLSKTEADKKKEEKKKANFVAIPEKAEEKMKKWKEEIVQLTEIEATANAEADKNLEEFEKRSEKPKEEQGKIQEVWSKCNAEYNKIRSEATVARDEYEDMKRMANSGTKKLEDLQSRLVSSEEQHEKDKEEVERLKRELESCRSRKKDAEDKLPTVKEKARDVFTKLSKAREKMNELKGQNEVKSRDNVVKMLLKEKEAGRIPSFVGRLGEMGVVDKKYEKALSTNWPGKEGLEILIVENQEDCVKVINTIFDKKISKHAARSLELLKKNTIPQKLKPLPVEHYGAPRVFDIIDCEDNLKPAFYAMVKDTVIVDSYKEAVRLNKTPKGRGVSVSTLDGTVIAPSGNVTGGGERTGLILTDKNKKPKQVTQQDLDAELEAAREVNELQAEFDTLKSEEQNLDRLVRELRFKCEDMSKRLSILTSSIQTGEPAIETLKKTIKSLQKEAEKNRVDVEDLDSKQKIVIDLDKKRDKLREEADKLEKRQSEIQSELDGIFKELVQNHRDEAKDALQKRQKLEKDIAKETANVSSSARNIAKCDENIARFEKEIEKKRQLCDALQEKAVDDTAIEAKKETLNKLEDTRKELEKEAKDVTKKQSELSAAETQLEQDLKLSRDSISELKQKMACDSQMVKEIEKNLASMKINRIPRFQFLEDSSRPEDVPMHPEDLAVDENQSNEEVERQKKQIANRMADAAYAKEFEMRQKVLENIESYEDVDGDKLIPITLLTDEQLAEITKRDKEELVFRLKQCEQQIDVLKAKVDISCIDTYVEKVKQYNEQVTKLSDVTESHRKHNLELQRLKQMRLEEFHSAFEFIGKHLVAVYKMLTDGGDAKLEYIDKDDPFRHGISFMVRPAKKAWKQIQFLSGGEKTLSSLALIFALHMFRPTPFYVMDEIDAALDYRNVSIIAQYVRQKTENAQFIIISLRNNMFELANRLVGIYKVDGCTKNVAIDPQRVCEMAKMISDNLGQASITLPEEVTQRFNETVRRQNEELTAQEKQYPNFPSSSEISKAEKIVTVEGRVRKEISTDSSSRPQSNATGRTTSSRSESRVNKSSAPRFGRNASQSSSRTPRKERNNENDETTPPTKRSNSTTTTTTTTTKSPRKSPRKSAGSSEKSKNKTVGNEEE